MRFIRRYTQVALTFVGSALVLFAAFGVEGTYERVAVAGVGLFILEMGIWQITRFFFPNEREFEPLRRETDFFLKLVRRLNRAAVDAERGSASAQAEMDRLEAEMHHSVQRLRRVAGKSEAELGLALAAEHLADFEEGARVEVEA